MDVARNAQELIWHGMAAQVQIAFGLPICKLPPDNVYFVKAREGFEAAPGWLDAHLDEGPEYTLSLRFLTAIVRLFADVPAFPAADTED